MSNNKQSSVEWLISQLKISTYWNSLISELELMECGEIDILKQAKAMHKEELEFAFKGGMSLVEGHLWKPIDKFEEFYNQKFNNEQTN